MTAQSAAPNRANSRSPRGECRYKGSVYAIGLLYIWPTPTKEWNFASAVNFPLAWVEVEANISLGPFTVRKKDSIFGLFDLAFTPIIASHHFSQTDHLACDFTFWAPTGSFKKGRLVNLSLNNWTFIPGVAYTKILPQANIELSAHLADGILHGDPATHYHNGILSDLEGLAIKRFKNGFGIGFVGSWIQQVTNDGGRRRRPSTVLSGGLLALVPLSPTPRSWVRVTSILVRVGSTTLTSASASRAMLSTLARA